MKYITNGCIIFIGLSVKFLISFGNSINKSILAEMECIEYYAFIGSLFTLASIVSYYINGKYLMDYSRKQKLKISTITTMAGFTFDLFNLTLIYTTSKFVKLLSIFIFFFHIFCIGFGQGIL